MMQGKDLQSRRALGVADLDLLESVFADMVDCPFFVKDAELTYVAANSAMVKMCGADGRHQLIGQRASRFFPPALARRYEVLDKEVLSSGRGLSNVVDLSLSAGRVPTWLIFSRLPVFDRRGKTVGVVATARSVGVNDRRSPAVRRLSEAIRRLRQSPADPLNARALAASVDVSASQLQRDFQQIFDMTPRAFQQKIRIETAIEMLEGDETISTIAHSCGFTDHSAFSRSFKKALGVTPSRYRMLFAPSNDVQ